MISPAYAESDVIEYNPMGLGSTRRVRVQKRWADIKNGSPGFGGICIEGGRDVGMSVWGYDDQITRVVERRAVEA